MIGTTLQRLLDEGGTNVNWLSRTTGISAQTLYSIIKRDNMKIDFEILLKICDVLCVDVDTFYKDYISLKHTTKQPPSKDEGVTFYDNSLSENENYLVNAYRGMDKSGQKALISSASSLFDVFKSVDTVPHVG